MLSDIGGSNHQMQLSAPCFDEVREKSDSVCYFVVIFFDKTSVTFLLAIWYYALSGNYIIFKSYIKLKLLYVYLPRKRIVILCYMYITHLFICCSQEHSIVYIHSFFTMDMSSLAEYLPNEIQNNSYFVWYSILP